jgi:hypothetical protein
MLILLHLLTIAVTTKQVPHATFPCPVVGYHKQITCKSVFNHRCYHVNGQIFVICLGKVLISKNHKSVSFIMPFLWIIIKIYDKHFSLLIFCWRLFFCSKYFKSIQVIDINWGNQNRFKKKITGKVGFCNVFQITCPRTSKNSIFPHPWYIIFT